MRETFATAESGLLQAGPGYVVDESYRPLLFVAVAGVGEVLEHRLAELEQFGRDVSPIILETHSRTVVVNLYEPDPVTVQVVQVDGPLERSTEIFAAGTGMDVLGELRRAARILDLAISPLSDQFCRRLVNETATYVRTYSLFRGEEGMKRTRFAETLRRLQDRNRREASLLRQLL